MNEAGLFPRFVAALIDNVLWLALTGFVFDAIPQSTLDENVDVLVVVTFFLATLWFNYFAYCEWRWGRTIGKNAMGLRVVSATDGKPVGFAQASLRNLARLVDVFVVGWVMISVSDRKQRLGDLMAKTVVIRLATDEIPGAVTAASAAPVDSAGPGEPTGAEPSSPDTGEAGEAPAALQPGEIRPEPALKGPGLPVIRWGVGRALAAAVAAPIAATAVGIAVVAPFDSDFESTASMLVLQGLLGVAFIAAAVLVAGDFGKRRISDAIESLGLGTIKPSYLGWGLLSWLGYLAGALLYTAIAGSPEQQDIASELGIDESTIAAVATIFLLCFFGPLSEEMVFRGMLFGGLRGRYGFLAAALLSAVLFGLVHAPTGLSTVIPLAFFGFVLACAYERTGSLWTPFAAHMINNSLVVAVAMVSFG